MAADVFLWCLRTIEAIESVYDMCQFAYLHKHVWSPGNVFVSQEEAFRDGRVMAWR